MKVIAWNCNMAFRKKADYILAHKPDILIVPECEHPDKLKFRSDTPKPKDVLWFGDNQNKGLGIFSYSHLKFKLFEAYNPELKLIIPIEVTGGEFDFTLFAIWANNRHDPDGQYVEQVWKALSHYNKLIKKKRTMFAGDFNSNSIWDRASRAGNHSDVVKRLKKKGISSCYHLHLNQIHGKEPHPTFYLYRHKNKSYHIDYCFASSDMTGSITSVKIGSHKYWMKHSDHVPLMVTFELP